jgi:hypothetical protein
MPYKDRKKQLAYLRAWRVANAERVKRARHQYYISHQAEFASRRSRWNHADRTAEGAEERGRLRSAREFTRWRDVPGEGRNPVRVGRRKKYLGNAKKRHAQAQRIYTSKRRAKKESRVEAPSAEC